MSLSQTIADGLSHIVGAKSVLTKPEDIIPYSFDGTAALRQTPSAVVFPHTAEDVSRCLTFAVTHSLPIVTRGSATGLSGGSVPSEGSVVLCLVQMNKILDIDPRNLVLRTQPGVTTLAIDEAASRHGLFYPPDPGSMRVRSICGHLAENSGGLRGLKYGVTRDYVMALELVLPDGRIARFGGKLAKDVAGYDLTRLFVGSEGTLGIITEATLKLIPMPETKKTLLALYQDL